MMTRWTTRLLLGGLLLSILTTSSVSARNWSYTYHPDATGPHGTIPGQLASVDGPRTDVADITSYAYDPQGNLIRTTNALGHISEITAHDAAGRPLTLVDPNGVVTTLTYDARGRLTSHTTAGATTTFSYDGVGNLTVLTLPTGVTLTYHYDAARRLTALEDSLGNRLEYELDAAGNRIEERLRDAAGQLRYAKQQLYDELSRLRQVVGLDGSQQRHYDVNGNLVQEVDGEANATAHAFDALNRLTQTTDALAGQTVYHYDGQDNLTEVVDPKGNATESRTEGRR